jgi:hypothetical protein
VTRQTLNKLFWDFVRLDRLTGGPDTHLDMIAHMSKKMHWTEGVWLAGCYVSVYNVPTGYRIWEAFPWNKAKSNRVAIANFIVDHWAGLSFRRERRAVRSVAKMSKHMDSYIEWVRRAGPAFFESPKYSTIDKASAEQRYELLWNSLDQSVWGLGRYALMKLMETFTRQAYIPLSLPDIRPVNGDSPRDMLAELYDLPELRRGNSPRDLADVADRVGHLRWTGRKQGIDITMFQTEVYLCEFKQATKYNQYPGRALDSEFGHYTKAAAHFGEWPDFFRIRKELFPAWALGEANGWNKRRDELGSCIPDHGYAWSDSIYDYQKTAKEGLNAPVQRNGSLPNGRQPVCECRYA